MSILIGISIWMGCNVIGLICIIIISKKTNEDLPISKSGWPSDDNDYDNSFSKFKHN